MLTTHSYRSPGQLWASRPVELEPNATPTSPVRRETLFSWTGNLPWGCSCKLAPLGPIRTCFLVVPRLLQPPGLPGVLLSRWGHSYSGNYLRHLHIKAFNNNMPSPCCSLPNWLVREDPKVLSSVQWLVLVGSVPPSSKGILYKIGAH